MGTSFFKKILGLRLQGYRDPGAGRGGGDVKGILEKGLPGLLHQRRRRLAAVAGSQADVCALIFLAKLAFRILQELIRSRDDWNKPWIVSNKYKRHIFFEPMQYLINVISKSLVFPKTGWEGPQSRETLSFCKPCKYHLSSGVCHLSGEGRRRSCLDKMEVPTQNVVTHSHEMKWNFPMLTALKN